MNRSVSRYLCVGLVVASSIVASGCTQSVGSSLGLTNKRPQFYPNDKLRSEGPAKAEAAAEYCMALADEYVKAPDRWEKAATDGLTGAVVGTATGAVGGAVFSKAGRGAGAGAAIGGILGVLRGATTGKADNQSYQRFVERCLQQKGYETVGWG